MVVGVQELFFRFTLDTIGKIAFGKDLESLRCGLVLHCRSSPFITVAGQARPDLVKQGP